MSDAPDQRPVQESFAGAGVLTPLPDVHVRWRSNFGPLTAERVEALRKAQQTLRATEVALEAALEAARHASPER
jgi:hypothetical protein